MFNHQQPLLSAPAGPKRQWLLDRRKLMDAPLCKAMVLIADLAKAVGAQLPLSKHPTCWEHDVDERWHIAWNGHAEIKESESGVEVQPYECYVQYNGWPAGMLDPFGGVIAAGEAANEETFCEAIQRAIEKAQEVPA